jgi:hypothetical protein
MSSPLKAVVDHHVDRPGVDAERSVQLTGTNRLIGLIALICDTHAANVSFVRTRQTEGLSAAPKDPLLRVVLCRPGGLSEEPEPDPIPNSAVKLLRADGTMSQDLGE